MLRAYINFVAVVAKSCIDLRTAVNCVNDLQSLMRSCQDVSNNDTYNKIYQKAADMVSPEEISTYVSYCKTSNDA